MKQKNLGIVLTVAFVAGLFGGWLSNYVMIAHPAWAQKTPQHPKSISAEEFRLVDGNGKTRAILHTVTENVFLHPKDKRKGELSDDIPGPHLTFFDDSGHFSASLGYFFGSGGLLSLWDNEKEAFQTLNGSGLHMSVGSTSAALNVDDSESQLFMATLRGDQVSHLGLGVGNGGPVQGVQGPLKEYLEKLPPVAAGLSMGATRSKDKENLKAGGASLSLTMDGEPTLEFQDKEGRKRASLGRTELITPRTGTTETRSVSSLVLFGPDGTVLWSAP